MKWICCLLLLALDAIGGWFIWVDTRNDWGNKPGTDETFLMIPLDWGEKKLDEETAKSLLNVEWKSSLPDFG